VARSGAADDSAIHCEAVRKCFGRTRALDGLDLDVPAGSVVGFLGPNGAGKSTTVRILLDLARPDAGSVAVLGADPRSAGPALRRRIGYVPGELRLDDRATVEEILRSWSRLRGDPDGWPRAAELCDRLGLDPSRQARALSSGNRRKVGIIGAFMSRPELLVLDEPTSGVDPLVREEFFGMVDEARAAGHTVFLSSHVLSDVQRVADSVAVLREGRVVAHDSVVALRRSARQRFSVAFESDAPGSELSAVPGVTELTVQGTQATGVIEGSPDDLLRVLARHAVAHVLFPEPDLEDAFLRFFEDPR
jgi:ABC-2 type transport system ATP-binding protein